MVGSNGIWPDGEPQSVREAYDNQPPFSRAGRREIPMTFEQRFTALPLAEQQRVLRDTESAIHLYGIVAIYEGKQALDRLCKIYGIK